MTRFESAMSGAVVKGGDPSTPQVPVIHWQALRSTFRAGPLEYHEEPTRILGLNRLLVVVSLDLA